MAEFNSYLLGKVTKSVGNITLVYTKRKNIAKAKVFKRKDNPTPEILEQRAKMKTLVQFGRRILPVVDVYKRQISEIRISPLNIQRMFVCPSRT